MRGQKVGRKKKITQVVASSHRRKCFLFDDCLSFTKFPGMSQFFVFASVGRCRCHNLWVDIAAIACYVQFKNENKLTRENRKSEQEEREQVIKIVRRV